MRLVVIFILLIVMILFVNQGFDERFFANAQYDEEFPFTFHEQEDGTYFFLDWGNVFGASRTTVSVEIRDYLTKEALAKTEYVSSFGEKSRITLTLPSDTEHGIKEIFITDPITDDHYNQTYHATFYYPPKLDVNAGQIISLSPQRNVVSKNYDNLKFTLETDKLSYSENDLINIRWTIQNVGIGTPKLQSGCGKGASPIWVESTGKLYPLPDLQPHRISDREPKYCPAVTVYETILPLGSISNQFTWNQYVATSFWQISKVNPGNYFIKAGFTEVTDDERYISREICLPIKIGEFGSFSTKIPNNLTPQRKAMLERNWEGQINDKLLDVIRVLSYSNPDAKIDVRIQAIRSQTEDSMSNIENYIEGNGGKVNWPSKEQYQIIATVPIDLVFSLAERKDVRWIILDYSGSTYLSNILPKNYELIDPNFNECTNSYLPPLKQILKGNPPNNVKCNDGLDLIIKRNDSSMCVKPETKQKLIERGWAKS